MQLITSITSVLAIAGAALAAPSQQARQSSAHFDFQAAPVGYSLDVPFNGVAVATNSNLNVNLFTSNIPDVLSRCSFDFSNNAGPATVAYAADNSGAIAVGPPSVLNSVTCT